MQKLDCEYLSDHCLRSYNKLSPIPSEDGHSDSGYGSELERTEHELYIPAPSDISKDQAFEYHLTTRNLLAYVLGKPLVGERLSAALCSLWQRMQEWQVGDRSIETFKMYCKGQGYLDLAENAEHALAFLKFAEEAQIRELWIDAFVHCVGMHQRLDTSPEWCRLSNTTVALITRASLEMDLHISRIIRALGGFLEEELGAEHLGLSKHARDHMDRFRSFLHAFYVDKLGYFPPKQNSAWNKRVWSRVHHDFQCLYDYLVDQESTFDLSANRGVTGGVCVVQNLTAFDQRHGYEPLSHPLPLLPASSSKRHRGVSSQRGLRTLSLSMSASAPELRATTRQVLENASNHEDSDVMACTLVQEYARFERQRLEEKLDVAEARKIRWILIYAVLQMLNSIMSAPKEVEDSTSASYPLCSLTSGCPPWKEIAAVAPAAPEPEIDTARPKRPSLVPDTLEALGSRRSRISIHPDCEAESAEKFFASTASISHRASQADLNMAPSPPRVNTQLNRRNSLVGSMHSSVNMLQKSVLGSLSRRGSSRRSSLVPEPKTGPKKMPSFCEIVVEGYGNGLHLGNIITDEPASIDAEDSPASSQSPAKNDFALFDFGLTSPSNEPTLEYHELAEPGLPEFYVDHPDLVDTSPRDSQVSDDFALYRVSSHGSFADTGTPATEPDVDYVDSPISIVSPHDAQYYQPTSAALLELKLHSYIPSKLTAGSCLSVNAGCYTPTGMFEPPRSRFSHAKNSPSHSSIASTASSVYASEPIQAGDIEEENGRGRRRSRALDSMARFGVAATSGFVS